MDFFEMAVKGLFLLKGVTLSLILQFYVEDFYG